MSDRLRRRILRLHHRKTREREGLVLVEGSRSCTAAIDAGAEIRSAAVSDRASGKDDVRRLVERLVGLGVKVRRLDDATMGSLSATETDQGALIVVKEPRRTLASVAADGPFRALVCDAVQDPGNLGTLLRSARAFGLDAAIALDGTVDPWSPKVVRASAGALFHLTIVCSRWDAFDRWRRDVDLPLLVADASGAPVGLHGVGVDRGRWALLVGNEGAGARDEALRAAVETVAVEMAGGGDSLNVGVAASILLYELTRRGPSP